MYGRVIDDDMFGIARRLKTIDDGYYIFRNYKTGRFEVHNSRCAPTLQLVLPYETLDERTVRKVRMTRAERVKQLFEEAERENARLEERMRRAAVSRAQNAVGG